VVVVTAGAMAAVVSVKTSLIANWITRFAATFDEYCIVGMGLELRVNNTGTEQLGFAAFFLDEKDSAAPTAANMNGSSRVEIMMQDNYNPIKHRIDWKPSDVADLDWVSTGTSVTPVYLKAFSSVADTFTSANTAGRFIITGTLAVSFRGWKN